jgi:hypothetical protein
LISSLCICALEPYDQEDLMDAESWAQIEQIVSGAEGRLSKEMATLGTSLRQEFRQGTETLAASVRQEFEVKLTEKFEEAERHSGALFEDVLDRIDLVVEGHQALHQKIEAVEASLAERIEHESLEMQSLLKLS